MIAFTREEFIKKYKVNPAMAFSLHTHITDQCRAEAMAQPKGRVVHKAYMGRVKWDNQELYYIIEVSNWMGDGRLKSLVLIVYTFLTEKERDDFVTHKLKLNQN